MGSIEEHGETNLSFPDLVRVLGLLSHSGSVSHCMDVESRRNFSTKMSGRDLAADTVVDAETLLQESRIKGIRSMYIHDAYEYVLICTVLVLFCTAARMLAFPGFQSRNPNIKGWHLLYVYIHTCFTVRHEAPKDV